MKTITVLLPLLVLLLCAKFGYAQGSHWVNGYYRNDGTFVTGHHQTNPNGNIFDNWSTRGNYNPYTGRAGTIDPFTPRYSQRPSYNTQGHFYRDAYGNVHYSPY